MTVTIAFKDTKRTRRQRSRYCGSAGNWTEIRMTTAPKTLQVVKIMKRGASFSSHNMIFLCAETHLHLSEEDRDDIRAIREASKEKTRPYAEFRETLDLR